MSKKNDKRLVKKNLIIKKNNKTKYNKKKRSNETTNKNDISSRKLDNIKDNADKEIENRQKSGWWSE